MRFWQFWASSAREAKMFNFRRLAGGLFVVAALRGCTLGSPPAGPTTAPTQRAGASPTSAPATETAVPTQARVATKRATQLPGPTATAATQAAPTQPAHGQTGIHKIQH